MDRAAETEIERLVKKHDLDANDARLVHVRRRRAHPVGFLAPIHDVRDKISASRCRTLVRCLGNSRLRLAWVVSRLSAFGAGVAQSAAAKCAIWSACAFTKDGRAVARAT